MILPIKASTNKPDLFFYPDTQAIIVRYKRIVSTIHDIAEYAFPEKYSIVQRLARRIIVKHQARISKCIITDSYFSKQDIVNRFHISADKVNVIYLATNLSCDYELVSPKKYFLFVSESEKAKNLIELIDAFDSLPDELRDEFEIKVVGKKGNDYENIITRIKQLGLEKKVSFFGYVSDVELSRLYKEAYAFVFPSYFEGFGLPVLEAMSKGTPVLCSDRSSIPEVGGDAVLTFSPYDYRELRDQIVKIANDESLRNEMIERGYERVKKFSYKKTAEETLRQFEMSI